MHCLLTRQLDEQSLGCIWTRYRQSFLFFSFIKILTEIRKRIGNSIFKVPRSSGDTFRCHGVMQLALSALQMAHPLQDLTESALDSKGRHIHSKFPFEFAYKQTKVATSVIRNYNFSQFHRAITGTVTYACSFMWRA